MYRTCKLTEKAPDLAIWTVIPLAYDALSIMITSTERPMAMLKIEYLSV